MTYGYGEPLFQHGRFKLNSGRISRFKIECDALKASDWDALAAMISEWASPYGEVVGVPTGGLKLEYSLGQYVTTGPRLIVDDVLTTGRSILKLMDRPDDVGWVVFARGPLPPRVRAVFRMPESVIAGKGPF